jgi:hypothetical protein
MLYVDADNTPAVTCTSSWASPIHSHRSGLRRPTTREESDHDRRRPTDSSPTRTELPRWSVADVHESLDARSFTDALERPAPTSTGSWRCSTSSASVPIEHRPVTADDASAADEAIAR